MIISRSPLRISIGGGGTDLPSYSDEFGGFLVASTINKYVYVSISTPFRQGIFLKYSEAESVKRASEVKHPIFRETLLELVPEVNRLEIHSFADVPSGTGLGSSGSFTTALVSGLYRFSGRRPHSSDVARLACEIEIDRLEHPSGKQDQFVSVSRGLNSFEFQTNGGVVVNPINLSEEDFDYLDSHLQLFYTGTSRDSENILGDQKKKTLEGDRHIIAGLHEAKQIGLATKTALEAGDLDAFGKLLSEQWEIKKRRSSSASSQEIDSLFKLGLNSGALGGKLIGAGGGGFLLFLSADTSRLTSAMNQAGATELPFSLASEECRIIVDE